MARVNAVVGVNVTALRKTGRRFGKAVGCEVYRILTNFWIRRPSTLRSCWPPYRHADTGDKLIARGIPFAIEKPCGMRAIDVDRLVAGAEAKAYTSPYPDFSPE